jgi:hypothetical protein
MMPYARRLAETSSLTTFDIQKTWIYETQALDEVNQERHGFNYLFEIANFGLRKAPRASQLLQSTSCIRAVIGWLVRSSEFADY